MVRPLQLLRGINGLSGFPQNGSGVVLYSCMRDSVWLLASAINYDGSRHGAPRHQAAPSGNWETLIGLHILSDMKHGVTSTKICLDAEYNTRRGHERTAASLFVRRHGGDSVWS